MDERVLAGDSTAAESQMHDCCTWRGGSVWGVASDDKREVLTEFSQKKKKKKIKNGDDMESSPTPGDVFQPPPGASLHHSGGFLG